MKVRQLEHFESLYRLHSFAEAAKDQAVTQSGLSRSLQRLEKHLGARLFDRTTHTVEPTELAERLIPYARNVVQAVSAFDEEAQRIESGTVGTVRIGTGPYPAQPLVTGAVAATASVSSGIQISVVTGTAEDLLAALLRRELECVVADTSKYDSSPVAHQLEVLRLPSEPLSIVMSPEHPRADDEWQLAGLAEEAWALPTLSPIGQRELPSLFGAELAPDRFPLFRLESTAACLELARSGRAITMVPKSLALRECRTSDLVARDAGPGLRTNDGIHLVLGRSRSPATQILIEQLQRTAKELAASVKQSEPHRKKDA